MKLVMVLLVACTGCVSSALHPDALRHNASGAALLAAGDLDAAEARFHLALEYHARFSEPRANLGLVALARGDLDLAERHLRAAVGLNEDFAEAWANLGVVLEAQGDLDEATEAYRESLSIHPGLVSPRRNLAFLLARRERFGASRAQLMRLLQVQEDEPPTLAMLAYCELRLSRPRAAADRAAQALAIDPELGAALIVRGVLRAQAGQLDLAALDLEAAAGDADVGQAARIRLAAVEILQGHLPLARSRVEALLEEAPGDPSVQLVAAELAMGEGRWRAARRHARAAARLSPGLAAAGAILTRSCTREPHPGCPSLPL